MSLFADGLFADGLFSNDLFASTPLDVIEGSNIIRAKIIRDDLALWDGITKRSSRTDETGGEVSGLTIGDSVDVLQIFGKTYTVATIKSALDFIGTDNNVTLLWSSGIWRIDSSIIIPANFANRIAGGCVFAISTGVTLTFNGPIHVEYGNNDGTGWYTLSGTGVVTCALGASGFPGW